MREQDQKARLRYVLSHGVKERLVSSVTDWPGASSVSWLLQARQIKGIWRNRTAEYAANRRVNFVADPGKFHEVYTVEMSPLPCWARDSPGEWRVEVAKMIALIEEDAACQSQTVATLSGQMSKVVGVARVLRTDPRSRPRTPKWSPAPAVHTQSRDVRRRWKDRLKQLTISYREASVAYRRGDANAVFPQGVFRPAGPFVPWSDPSVNSLYAAA